MTTQPTQVDTILGSLAEVKSFMVEKYDPLNQSVGVLGEEMERLTAEVKEILDLQRNAQRAALLHQRSDEPKVEYRSPSGEVQWVDALDIKILKQFWFSHWRDKDRLTPDQLSNLPNWKEHIVSVQKALDSTTAGAGDELVPTNLMTELWMDINLQTSVKSLFRTIQMPTNPFDIPLQLGDVNWYRGSPNKAATSTDLTTAQRTLTATEFVAVVAWAYELDEDAVIAMLPEIRATLVRNAAEVMDDLIINGDTRDAGANINFDGAASGAGAGVAGRDHLLAFDGLRSIPILNNTGQHVTTSAAVSNDMFNAVRTLMDKYGVRPSEIATIMDLNTFIRSQSLSEVRTLDKFGPQATILTGQLGAVEGIPIIVSEQLLLADTDGKVTAAGNGTDTGTFLMVNRTQFWTGTRRELLVETERDIQKRQTIMVVSFRMAFDGRNTDSSDNAVAMRSNITGVS